MTDIERGQIVALQQKGYGYKKISSDTGLPVNTVKSFLRRHPLQSMEPHTGAVFCRHCGKPIEQAPHKREKLFCSDTCRMAWWNAHPEKVERKAYYTLTCEYCRRQFQSYGNDHRRFCSRACYADSRRKENKV